MAEMQRNTQNYVEYLKEQAELFFSNGCGVMDVHIHMDCDGWSGDVTQFSVPAHDKAKLFAAIEGMATRVV